jgi:hypothetical protein
MNQVRLAFSIAFALVGVATPLALQACGGDNGPVTVGGSDDGSTTNTDGASTTRPDTSTTADTSTPADSGTPEDTGTPSDGGPTPVDAADTPDGGQPVTPGTVECGGAACNIQQNTCCAQADGGGTCVPGASASCPAGTGTVHCAEAANCTGGNVCCGSFDIVMRTISTQCAAGPCAQAQPCHTNGECTGGKKCVVQDCFGRTVELCGLFLGCTAK